MSTNAVPACRTERILFVTAALAGAVCIVVTLASAAGWIG
jgi:hypothetical protein